MSGESSKEDKTEAATSRRLQKAREEGQVPVSRELTGLAGLAAVTLALVMLGPGAMHEMIQLLRVFLARTHELAPGVSTFHLAGLAWLRGAAPFVLAALLAGVLVVLLQTRFLLSGKALKVDFKRVSPGAGLKRLLGPESLVEAVKSVAKIVIIGMILWQVMMSDMPMLMSAPFGDPNQILARAAGPVLHVLLVVLAAQAAIAVLDYGWVMLRHVRGLRMSRHDIQEEMKESEGDPRVKARQRQIRTMRARRRMMAAVPKATVVITNPTHYAVALAYDRAKHAAPRVVAKGVDSLAARIREAAEANHVPVVANPPLARALYQVALDADIPAEHYQAVAAIIAYVWRLARPRGNAA
jgi:flagellar biosynthetic protein FlhB